MANGKKETGIPRGRKGGRKLLLTPKLIEKMEELFKLGCTDKAVYNGVCISITQFYNWKNFGEEALKKRETEGVESLTKNELLYASFLEKTDKALADFQAEALKVIKTASLKSWQAAAWALERRLQDNFAVRNKIDMKHAGKLKIEFEDVKAEHKKEGEKKQEEEVTKEIIQDISNRGKEEE